MSSNKRVFADLRTHFGGAFPEIAERPDSLLVTIPEVRLMVYLYPDRATGWWVKRDREDHLPWIHVPAELLDALLVLQEWADASRTPKPPGSLVWTTDLFNNLRAKTFDGYEGSAITIVGAPHNQPMINGRIVPREALALMAICREYARRAKETDDDQS